LLKQIGTKGALQHATPSLIVPKASVAIVDSDRLARAQIIARSPHISHHSAGHPAVLASVVPLAVQPEPRPEESAPTVAPSPQPNNAPPAKKPADNIFEHALANATHFVDVHAHRAHFHKQARRHMASMAAGTVALVV